MRLMGVCVRIACVLCTAAMACSTAYSGGETLVDASTTSGDASPEAPTEVDAASSPDVASTSDGAGDVDAGGPDGQLAVFTFEDGTTCAPWVVGPNTTTEIVGGGVTGSACRVCSQADGGSRIFVNVDGVGPGTYRAATRVKDESYAGTVQIELRFQGDGGTTIGPNASAQPSTTQWKDLMVSGPVSFAPSPVVVVITAYSGPGCILVDDATLAIDP